VEQGESTLARSCINRIDIMLVEPDDAVRDSIRLLFETAGFTVCALGDAVQLQALLLDQAPRCLVLAVELQPLSGIELLAQLREGGIQIPAIVTSCKGGVPMAVEAMRAGATDFLEKPLMDARLLSIVRRHLA
jgi:two-component system response regulator FixJ